MPAYSTVKRAVLGTDDPTEKKVRFLSLLASEVGREGPRPVLVGGSAIEVYLDGVLRTGDMDIVFPMERLKRVLRGWKFELGGGLRAWVNEELGLAVDMVGGELTGSPERVTTIATRFGPATIIGVEDLILKRLASAEHWRIATDMEQAYLLARAYEEEVDWGYVEEQAARQGTGALLSKLRETLAGSGPTKGVTPPRSRGRRHTKG